jgi:hypothetical protein
MLWRMHWVGSHIILICNHCSKRDSILCILLCCIIFRSVAPWKVG